MSLFTSPQIIVNFILLLTALVAMIYGIALYFKPKKAMYAQLVTCAMACFMLYHLFNMVCLVCRGTVSEGFGSGIFGFIGAFMFLFCASFGQMDGLVDDHSNEMVKYRLAALVAPVCIALLYIPVFKANIDNDVRVMIAIKMFFIAQTSYYALKHTIIKDEELGIIQSIKPFNVVVLILCFLYALSFVAGVTGQQMLAVISAGGVCVVYLVIIPVLNRGIKKWTI